jgi:hypothetical protein
VFGDDTARDKVVRGHVEGGVPDVDAWNKRIFFFLKNYIKKKTQHNKAAKERKWGV